MENKRLLRDVTVVIPTVGRPILQRCLESIAAGTVLPARLIAVDQGENPRVSDWLGIVEAVGVGVLHVRSSGRSAASARNQGIGHVHTPFIAAIDDDCIAEKNWLESMWGHLHKNPAVIVTGRLVPAGEGIPPTIVTSTVPCLHTRPSARDLCPLTSANMGFSAGTAERIGRFDEKLRTAEEIDWAYRALRLGVPILYRPEIVVHHVHWRSRRQMNRVYREYAWGLGGFYGKHLRSGDWSMLSRISISLYTAAKKLSEGAVHRRHDSLAESCSTLAFLVPAILAGLGNRAASS